MLDSIFQAILFGDRIAKITIIIVQNKFHQHSINNYAKHYISK